MDTGDMRELLNGYLTELNWSSGFSKDDVLEHLAGRDESLRTMVNEYIPEGTYQDIDAFMGLIPSEAWQSVQGDQWRGAESQYVEDVDSNFRNGQVGQEGSDSASSSGTTSSASGTSDGKIDVGEPGSNAGEVDLGVSGIDEESRGPTR